MFLPSKLYARFHCKIIKGNGILGDIKQFFLFSCKLLVLAQNMLWTTYPTWTTIFNIFWLVIYTLAILILIVLTAPRIKRLYTFIDILLSSLICYLHNFFFIVKWRFVFSILNWLRTWNSESADQIRVYCELAKLTSDDFIAERVLF